MKTGSLRVSIGRVKPNSWNPNELSPDLYKKLKRGLQELIDNKDKIPPIIVRPSPKRRCYEIIDGEHRWKAMQEMKFEKINVYSIDVDDKSARILTNNLNYLRGSPDYEKYGRGIIDLIGMGMKTTDLASLLPNSEEEIDMIIEENDITIEAFQALQDEDREALEGISDSDSDKDVWIDLKFRVTSDQARVIEKELGRIGDQLRGKNRRARALEFMSVLSSQSDLPDDGAA